MQAAILYGIHDIRVEETKTREPNADEVVIKVKACGICGTDVHIYNGDEGSAKVEFPITLGHEFSGTIWKTGEKAKKYNTGDRVCVDPNDMCGHCFFCLQGKSKFCENHIGIGTTVEGAFAEYITVREKQVYMIPDDISFEEAAMVEPISCCLNAIDLIDIDQGKNVLIIGGGPIGLLMLQLVRNCGAGIILLSEPEKKKRIIGAKIGADIVIDPYNEDIFMIINENGIKNIDVVIECVGQKSTMEDAVKYAGKGSTVMLFGLTPPSCEISINPYEVFKKELTIRASFINPYTFQRAIAIVSNGKICVNDIISEKIDLNDIKEVLANDFRRKAGKVMLII